MKQLVGAQNAQLTVNGIDIERQSNTVTDAPQGITLELTKEIKTPPSQSRKVMKRPLRRLRLG